MIKKFFYSFCKLKFVSIDIIKSSDNINNYSYFKYKLLSFPYYILQFFLIKSYNNNLNH